MPVDTGLFPPYLAFDTFSGSELSSGWSNAYSVEGGTNWSDVGVSNGNLILSPTPTTVNDYANPTDNDRVKDFIILGHSLLYRSLGVTDNVEIGVLWKTPENLSIVHQVAPAAFIDIGAADTQVGLAGTWDVSLSAMGFQNIFRTDLANTFDISLSRVLKQNGTIGTVYPSNQLVSGDIALDISVSYGFNTYHTIKMKCYNGQVKLFLDDVAVLGPFTVPSPYAGRDKWGLTITSIHYAPGTDLEEEGEPSFLYAGYESPIVEKYVPALVGAWWAKPITSF